MTWFERMPGGSFVTLPTHLLPRRDPISTSVTPVGRYCSFEQEPTFGLPPHDSLAENRQDILSHRFISEVV